MYTFGVFRRFQFHKLEMLPDDVFWGDMNQGLPGMGDQENIPVKSSPPCKGGL